MYSLFGLVLARIREVSTVEFSYRPRGGNEVVKGSCSILSFVFGIPIEIGEHELFHLMFNQQSYFVLSVDKSAVLHLVYD